MFQEFAKHRANDASNDVHRLPLGTGGRNTPLAEKIRLVVFGGFPELHVETQTSYFMKE